MSCLIDRLSTPYRLCAHVDNPLHTEGCCQDIAESNAGTEEWGKCGQTAE